MRSTLGKTFNRYAHDKYDVWIHNELRSKDFEDTYKMRNNLQDIKYDYSYDCHYKTESFLYCVGSKESLKRKYQNYCRIRKVIAENELEYKELLPLLAIEFVRSSECTVIPFPFKYIREYINNVNKEINL